MLLQESFHNLIIVKFLNLYIVENSHSQEVTDKI